MVSGFLPAVLAGLCCGVFSGLGVGGGSLLMVWMTAILSMQQHQAQGINLLYFIPTAAGAFFFHKKQGTLCWKAIIPAAITGCIFAAVFSLVAMSLDVSLLRKLFGAFLLLVGITEFFKKG